MKCNEAEKSILLNDSGELSQKYGSALTTHLDHCISCQSFRNMLIEAREISFASEEPSETVLNTIKREARRIAPETKREKTHYWKPALAMAASFMLLTGLFFSTGRPDRVGLELVMSDTELLGTHDQIVSVMYDGLSDDDLAFNFLMTYNEDL
jgi:hypothetical protein